MEFLSDLGLFVAKAVIVVLAITLVIGAIARAASRSGGDDSRRGHLEVRRVNDRYRKMALAVKKAALPAHAARTVVKEEKARKKAERKAKGVELAARVARPRVFIISFDGNLRATGVRGLREEITAILAVARASDEVVVKIKSPGGLVHAYGLAAAQLERIRARDIHLTVAVDLVAASGGYLMACVAHRVVAAPFAIVGSIGVVAGIPNVHRLLKKNDVDFELLTAGEYKRTLTVFGENTEAGRAKFQQDLDETHALFKAYIARYRPKLDLAKVATGEHWYGTQAHELGLVDAIATSDDLLLDRLADADLITVEHVVKRSFVDKLTGSVETALDRGVDRVVQRTLEQRYP